MYVHVYYKIYMYKFSILTFAYNLPVCLIRMSVATYLYHRLVKRNLLLSQNILQIKRFNKIILGILFLIFTLLLFYYREVALIFCSAFFCQRTEQHSTLITITTYILHVLVLQWLYDKQENVIYNWKDMTQCHC